MSFIGCVAIGMTLVTISGNIMSFALGTPVGVTAMVFIVASNWLGFGLGLVVGLLFGSLLTGLQGLLIGWVRANPIIVSIAALALIYGITQAFAERGTITPIRASSPHRSKERWRRPNRVYHVRALCTVRAVHPLVHPVRAQPIHGGIDCRAAEAVPE